MKTPPNALHEITEVPTPECRRPYATPSLAELGSVDAVTAGPDGDKDIDMIVGDDGGFARQDGTS